jgi:hypothetical protein
MICRRTLGLAIAGAGVAGGLAAQQPPVRAHPAELVSPHWPFPAGELAEYDVTFGPVRVGRARLRVEAIDTVRTTPAYRLSFEIEGGLPFYKMDDRTVSWLATGPYRSLRFEQILREGDYRRHRRYEIDQDAGTMTREDWDPEAGEYRPHRRQRDLPIPAAALDEISFLYLSRMLPLEIGRSYRFDDYFEEDGNPVVIEVLRRERIRVPAGRFDTVVIRPIFQTDGMFGQDGRAEVYMTDDDRRLIVQIKSSMRVGSIDMYLRTYESGR